MAEFNLEDAIAAQREEVHAEIVRKAFAKGSNMSLSIMLI